MKIIKSTLIIAMGLCISHLAFADQVCLDNQASTTPIDRFTVEGATITDTATGLIWQRCALGQTWDGSTCTGEADKYATWLDALNAAKTVGDGYRLPNIKEYLSIVDYTCYSPAVNKEVFPNFVGDVFMNSFYWTSTPNVYVDDSVVMFDMYNGSIADLQPGYISKSTGSFTGGPAYALTVKSAD